MKALYTAQWLMHEISIRRIWLAKSACLLSLAHCRQSSSTPLYLIRARLHHVPNTYLYCRQQLLPLERWAFHISPLVF